MTNLEKAQTLVAALKAARRTVSFAESCTGGLCAATVVSVPGASEVFFGGVVSYDNSVKKKLLHVERRTLESVGAVSAECAVQMANGVREATGTDIAVSVTGIAGPGGGSAEKPVGLVYIGVSTARESFAKKCLLGDAGGRTAIREAAVGEALDAAAEALKKQTLL